MHIILQSINHMNIYNSLLRRSMISSALRDNLVSFTQVWQSLLNSIFLKVPLILQFVLSALLSPSHYLLSSFSKESTQSTLLSVAQSFKFQVSFDKLCKTIWKRGRKITRICRNDKCIAKVPREESYKSFKWFLTFKFKITSLCKKWGIGLLNRFPYIVFSHYPKSILRVAVNFHFHRY
jgi:hypothetical protein